MSANTRKTDPLEAVKQPVEQIWLAGLGALALTEEEGSNLVQEGTNLFKSLVKKGEGFEKVTRERLDEAVEATKAAPGIAMERIDKGMNDTMNVVLRRLGVPTQTEINSLKRRVEGLATTLEGRKPRTARARTTTKRRTAKTAS